MASPGMRHSEGAEVYSVHVLLPEKLLVQLFPSLKAQNTHSQNILLLCFTCDTHSSCVAFLCEAQIIMAASSCVPDTGVCVCLCDAAPVMWILYSKVFFPSAAFF